MIPKKIHYIWVGGKEKPKEVQKCISTWKKRFKDYEIIEWNENNFEIEKYQYTKNAYNQKKWAFVSDYIRLYALYNYGGIYLDTDVIAVSNIDEMLENRAFFGFENKSFISAAVVGAEQKHPFIKELLEYYDNLKNETFKFEDNNSVLVTNKLKQEYSLKLNNENQKLKNGIVIYNDRILSNPSSDSKTIHIFTGTWLNNKSKLKQKICRTLKYRLTNRKLAGIYEKIIRNN